MTRKLNATERAFDILSSILWLKGVMKGMFIMGTILGMLPFWVEGWEPKSELAWRAASYFGGVLFFGWIFRLWDRRDRERKAKD